LAGTGLQKVIRNGSVIENLRNYCDAVKAYAVGYCKFDKDGERFWFHIERWEFQGENNWG
jgi:hypothetical protein